MSSLGKAAALLFTNPAEFIRRVNVRLKMACCSTPSENTTKEVNGIKFHFEFDLDPEIRLMYLGVYEPDLLRLFKRRLKPGMCVIDVGGNIGYTASVEAGLVTKTGSVHSFEPTPCFFEKLSKLKALNPNFPFFLNQIALGEEEGSLDINITNIKNIGWNTAVPGLMSEDTIKETTTVKMLRLDKYIEEQGLKKIDFIKIDVEGFEFPVLKGLSHYFEADSTNRPPISVEVAPAAYPKLNTSLKELKDFMAGYGYKAFDLDEKKAIDINSLTQTTDILFKVD